MRTTIYNIKNLIFSTLLCFALIGCKNNTQNSQNEETGVSQVSLFSKSKIKSEESKIIKGIVEVQFYGLGVHQRIGNA